MHTASTFWMVQVRRGSSGHWAQGQPRHVGWVGSTVGAEACVCCPAAAMGSLLPCLALFAHLVSNTLLQGSATSHVAPVEPADRECCSSPGGGWAGADVGRGQNGQGIRVGMSWGG